MEWNLDANTPIYSQIVYHLELAIVSGEFPPGSQIPPVRALAIEAGVNPNTMQRALQTLEQENLVYSKRTTGRFVTRDIKKIEEIREALANESTEIFLSAMKDLGFETKEIIAMIRAKRERSRIS